jgi:hypothetical protein
MQSARRLVRTGGHWLIPSAKLLSDAPLPKGIFDRFGSSASCRLCAPTSAGLRRYVREFLADATGCISHDGGFVPYSLDAPVCFKLQDSVDHGSQTQCEIRQDVNARNAPPAPVVNRVQIFAGRMTIDINAQPITALDRYSDRTT